MPASDKTAMRPGLVVLVLALLLGIQPVATDFYLPALPLLTEELGGTVAQAQLTLTALLLCFGLSQLVLGPLSDRFGRRPVLLWGMGVFTLAGVGNMLAPSIGWLIFTRAVQGAAMGAAVMCARAIIRDLYEPEHGARIMARALGGLGIIALISPLLGGLLLPLTGWRVALGVLALFGGGVLLLLALRFEETARKPVPLRLRPLMRNWRRIARDPGFIAWAGLQAACYGGLFTFLAASSFVFLKVYGLSRPVYGLAMSSSAVAFVAGTLICRRLLPRLGLQHTVRVAGALSLGGGTIMGLLAMAGVHTWWAFLLPHYLFMLGHGIHQPCSQTGSVANFPEVAGTASALSGCLLTLVAFAVGAWLGARIDGTVFPLVNGVWFWSCVIAFIAWVLVQRHGGMRTQAVAA